MAVVIDTERFHLRELAEEDATERYLGWFGDPAITRYISAGATKAADLRAYIRTRVGRDDVLFLGIFDRATGLHLGNIKFEPLDSALGYATMGILIGDAAFRGKGVTPEVLKATAAWLRANRRIRQIVLGVHTENAAAIRVYERTGFVVGDTPHIPGPHPGSITMIWQL